MSTNFKKIAQSVTTLSELMEGRTKMGTHEVVAAGEVTITAFDIVPGKDKNGEDKMYCILQFKEFPDRFYSGGHILTQICEVWAAEFGGDIESACHALVAEGGVTIKISEKKTRSGNNLVAVDIL